MKISDTPSFLKKTRILPTPPFLWEKSETPSPLPSFFENFEKLIKWGSSYVLEKKSSGKFDFLRFYLKKNKILSKSVKGKFSNNP